MIKNLNNKIFLAASFLVTTNYIFFAYRIIFRQNPYIAADWLINYQGGFVRRGLLGEIFYQINNILKFEILYVIYFFNIIVIILFFYLLYKIIKNSLSNDLFLIYCLLPTTIFFTFFDPLAIGRKDYLITISYFAYAYYLENFTNLKKIFLIFIFFILTLTHELVVFFIPFLFITKYLSLTKRQLSFDNFKFEIICSILMIITLVTVMIFKVPHNNGLCNSLLNLNLNKDICNGVIRDFSNPTTISLGTIKNNILYFKKYNYFINYFIYFFLSYIPIFLLCLFKNNQKKLLIEFAILQIFSVVFFLPIILVTSDWGRYINVLLILNIIYLHFLLKNLQIKNIKFSYLKKIIMLPIIVFYLTSWHMPHCCQINFGKGYNYILDRIVFRINDESNETHKFGKDTPRYLIKRFINFF